MPYTIALLAMANMKSIFPSPSNQYIIYLIGIATIFMPFVTALIFELSKTLEVKILQKMG